MAVAPSDSRSVQPHPAELRDKHSNTWGNSGSPAEHHSGRQQGENPDLTRHWLNHIYLLLSLLFITFSAVCKVQCFLHLSYLFHLYVLPSLFFHCFNFSLCLFVFYLAGCLTNFCLSLLFSFTHYFPFFSLSGPLCWVVWHWSRSECCQWFLTCCEAPRMQSSVLSRVCWGTSPDTAKTKLIWVSESLSAPALCL